ncbi:uncharacterized protein LOC135138115 isoform X3 [Zophobas morio]
MNPNLVQVWRDILANGLPSDTRKELITKYPLRSNCPLLAAPRLNQEARIAISEVVARKDARLIAIQNQMGAGLSGLATALDLIFATDRQDNFELRLVECISDAAKLFGDIHHDQSQARRQIIKATLSPALKDTLSEASVDGWLFGDNLSERIKTAKPLERTSADLKRTPVTKPRPPPVVSHHQDARHLNYKGPSRYRQSHSRGGAQHGHSKKSSRQSQQAQIAPSSRRSGTHRSATNRALPRQ